MKKYLKKVFAVITILMATPFFVGMPNVFADNSYSATIGQYILQSYDHTSIPYSNESRMITVPIVAAGGPDGQMDLTGMMVNINEFANPYEDVNSQVIKFKNFEYLPDKSYECEEESIITNPTYQNNSDTESVFIQVSSCGMYLEAGDIIGNINYEVTAGAPVGEYYINGNFLINLWDEETQSHFEVNDPNAYSLGTIRIERAVTPDIKLLNPPYIYTGESIKPEISVTAIVDGKTIDLKRYCDIKYGENIEVGTNTGSVTVSPNYLYTFTPITINFDIINKPIYDVIDGDKAEFIVGENPVSFRIDANYENFVAGGKVYVDGTLVDEDNYTADSGSTIITFTDSFINSLKSGEHELLVAFADGGEAKTSFTLMANGQKDPTSTDTEESNNIPSMKVPDTGLFMGIINGSSDGIIVIGILAGIAITITLIATKKYHKIK